MALLRLPEGRQQSGSAGGLVFSHNRYGPYIRTRSVPVNPKTPVQQFIRSCLTSLTERWDQTLTAVQRAAWDLYAANVPWPGALGENHYLTGKNHFIRSNTSRLQCGYAIKDAAPVIFDLPATDPTFNVEISVATQKATIIFDDELTWCDENSAGMALFQGQPRNPSVNFFNGPWKFIEPFHGNSVTPPSSPKVTGVLPFPVGLGQHVWLQARILRADGRLSAQFRDDCFCGA
jgi:hypothetical protein